MNAYFELTGLTGHEVCNSAELLPGRQTLLCPVLLQRARTVLPKPAAVAKPTVAMAPPRVEARRPHRLLPLIVACIDGRHVEESGDGVELFPHLNCKNRVNIEDELEIISFVPGFISNNFPEINFHPKIC